MFELKVGWRNILRHKRRSLVTLLAVILAGHWMTGYLMDYCVSVFRRAAVLVG